MRCPQRERWGHAQLLGTYDIKFITEILPWRAWSWHLSAASRVEAGTRGRWQSNNWASWRRTGPCVVAARRWLWQMSRFRRRRCPKLERAALRSGRLCFGGLVHVCPRYSLRGRQHFEVNAVSGPYINRLMAASNQMSSLLCFPWTMDSNKYFLLSLKCLVTSSGCPHSLWRATWIEPVYKTTRGHARCPWCLLSRPSCPTTQPFACSGKCPYFSMHLDSKFNGILTVWAFTSLREGDA